MIDGSRRRRQKPRTKSTGKSKYSPIAQVRQQGIDTQLVQKQFGIFSHVAVFSELITLLAHDLNQPLAAILSNAQAAVRLMERGTPDLNELRAIFEDIILDDHQASEMIRRVQSKFRKECGERKPLHLNDLVQAVMPIVHGDLPGRNVFIELELEPSLPLIKGKPIQLQQVIFSLIVNAFDAMSTIERPGKLILRTREADRMVVLDVVDSGCGIPDGKLNSIFDLFVSTKAEALGMGLALSRSIVLSHNGRLWAENNAEGGATFHLALPAENSLKTAPPAGINQIPEGDAGQRSRGLTILVADDKETFRHAVATILSNLSDLKHLAEAADGEEAVQKAAELRPDLVLLDVGLPVVDGVEAATRIRAVAPDARILFLTQYDSPDFVSAALRVGALGYVLKVDAGSELLQAAMAVARGEKYLSSGVRQ